MALAAQNRSHSMNSEPGGAALLCPKVKVRFIAQVEVTATRNDTARAEYGFSLNRVSASISTPASTKNPTTPTAAKRNAWRAIMGQSNTSSAIRRATRDLV